MQNDLSTQDAIDELEKYMLSMPAEEVNITHHHMPGVYIREGLFPAHVIAIGHRHKKPHANILLRGKIAVSDIDGNVNILAAPCMWVGQPGRKFAYILEETVWLNVHATEETDIEKLEAEFIDNTPFFLSIQQGVK